MSIEVMYSSKTDNWATPQDFFDKLNNEFYFTLDPCADAENAKCEKYYTKQDDGLSKAWGGVVFCNPPYGREIHKWVRKAYEESKCGATVVLLIPARTDTSYFHEYILGKSEIRFIRGRLKFGDGKSPAPFPSMLCIFRGN